MASLAPFFQRVRPALDAFVTSSSKEDLKKLESELYVFNWLELKIVHVHVLLPLVLKMEELQGKDQDLRTGLLNCIRLVVSNVYLNEEKSLCTILTIALKQIRDFDKAKMLPNTSEELKMAVILCISEALKRPTSDVFEKFYTKTFATLLGQVLLMLVEIIEFEKYRQLRIAAIECLMVVFYVHDEAESQDIVLRAQVADTVFIYLPKVLSVLFKTATSDDKIGESLKSISIKALGRILNIMYEETNDPDGKKCYDIKEFRKLIQDSKATNEGTLPDLLNGPKVKKEEMKDHFTRMQNRGRSSQWFKETSVRLNGIFKELSILCSHPSAKIRQQHAQMCSLMLQNCSQNLKANFVVLLENLIALSEDEDESVRTLARDTLKSLRQNTKNVSIFNESADMLFDEHSTKLIQILHRKDEFQLYVELLFFKGLLRNIGSKKLYSLLSLQPFMESFCMALITTVDLEVTQDLLKEEYALRQIIEADYNEYSKFHWRHFKFLENSQCIRAMEEICSILGGIPQVNRLIFDYLLDLLQSHPNRMNEILLIIIWMFTLTLPNQRIEKNLQTKFIDSIMEYILNDIHWHLALSPDPTTNLKVNRPSYWFVDRVPGLYESGIEIRMQDCDSDDEEMEDANERVGIADVQRNVLHTCIILEALGHCAKSLGNAFRNYIFHCLHKVLLKVASSNTMLYQAAMFCLMSIQKALGYANPSQLIEAHTDYLSYHLNMTLRRTPESCSAVDILSVILQLSSRNTVPHLESIFQTIREECSRAQQEKHICAYLRVFNAFLVNVERWETNCIKEINNKIEIDNQLEIDNTEVDDSDDILVNWLEILEQSTRIHEDKTNTENKNENSTTDANESEMDVDNPENNNSKENCDSPQPTVELPRHIEIIKEIIQQTIKFISSSSQSHQIQSLECLIVGVPQLRDYENQLLPLVHEMWQPLLEKFRQKDPLVLNRCFTLLNVLSTYAKDFILKRSLDDVIPYLKYFLKDSAAQSAIENTNTQTQLYKLQLKLLQEFSNLIKTMTIDGKHLNDIAEVISLYLSQKQPKELQNSAVNFFSDLKSYNGPLIYLITMKKCHLLEYKENVDKILSTFGL